MSQDMKLKATELFKEHFQVEADIIASAPGRVNLIGEHTDYVEGFVFPAALQLETAVAFKRRTDDRVRAVSANLPGEMLFSLGEKGVESWGMYVAGVAWALLQAGYKLSGVDIAVASNVPTGSSLSSSAAIEVALARAWRKLDQLELDDVQIAKIGQQAENHYVGIPSGILDQFASSVPKIGEAIVLDCQDLSYQVVALPKAWSFVVIDSKAPRLLASSAYRERVAECAEIAKSLNLPSLRALEEHHLSQLEGLLLKRARHIYSENARVLAALAAMRQADMLTFGKLMCASHASLRDDYQVSSDSLDKLVDATLSFEGCYGARMTGGGFGGCVVALVKEGDQAEVAKAIAQYYPQGEIVAHLLA
ncbi:MAG: galactokinase [Deinococcales bacterium]